MRMEAPKPTNQVSGAKSWLLVPLGCMLLLEMR